MESENLEKIQELEVKEEVAKPKRERTEAQKANTEKMRQALLAKHEASRKAKAEAEAEKKKKLEEKIVKKAETIKKKEAKALKVIEDVVSDDDDDDQLEQPVAKPVKAKPVKAKPKPKPKPVEEFDDEFEDEDDEQYLPPPQLKRQTNYPQQSYYQPPIQQRNQYIIKYV
jgi:hypothetical protein